MGNTISVSSKRVGLALGGGGAKGLAHVPILETLDDLGVRPSVISGTSIGAIIGALYASGLSGRETREEIEEFLYGSEEERREHKFSITRSFRKLLDVLDLDLDFSSGGFVQGEKFLDQLYEDLKAQDFDELEIPLKVVVSDFWSREQVVLASGPLRPAVRASMSLPVLFSPVVIEGRVMIDGGAVNPVPYDLLLDECDVTIAVDVSGARPQDADDPTPSLTDAVFNTFQIMSKAIVDEKRRRRPPDLYLQPDIVDVQVLEFDRADEIFAAAGPACRELREKLPALLG